MTQSGAQPDHPHRPDHPTSSSGAAHLAQVAAIVDHLLEHGVATRTELAAVAGVGRTATSALVTLLVERGVAIESNGSPGARGARVALGVAGRPVLVAGVAGDDAVATLVELDGTEIARYEEPVALLDDDPRGAAAAALDALALVVDRAVAQAARDGRHLAAGAIVVQGAVVGSPELAVFDDALGLEPVDVLGALRDRSERFAAVEPGLAIPPALIAGPAVHAVAEAAAHRAAVLLHISGDSQVAAGIAIGGTAYHGAHGLAGTLAHLPVVPDGLRCGCGRRGCLTTVASPGVVLEKAELADFERQYGRRAALDELAARIADADDRACWAWLDAARWIGRALQAAVPAIDPDVITVGGWWAALAADLEAAFRDNRPELGGGALASIPRVVPAVTGPTTGFGGAARQVRERLRSALVTAAA